MKKVIKLSIIILILIITIILINYIRNTVISNKIIISGNNFFNTSNYHITIKTETVNENYNLINEIYYKDSICLINTYNNNKLTEVYWKNYLTEECIAYYPDTLHTIDKFNEELITSIKNELILKDKSFSIFDFIMKKNNCYVIKDPYINRYFDKKTGLLIKKEYYFEENNTLNNISEYKFELNTVKDEQVKRPEV